MILANISEKSFGLLNMSTLENIKYKNIKVEITDRQIVFYCMSNYQVFYKYEYSRKGYDDDLDLYRALLALDERIISDILDPFSTINEYKLIMLSNTVHDMIKYMSS